MHCYQLHRNTQSKHSVRSRQQLQTPLKSAKVEGKLEGELQLSDPFAGKAPKHGHCCQLRVRAVLVLVPSELRATAGAQATTTTSSAQTAPRATPLQQPEEQTHSTYSSLERNEKPQFAALLFPLHEACPHCWKCVKADTDLILALCK